MFGRFVYFLAVGWWLGMFTAILAYLLCLSIIGLPFGVILLNRLPTLVFLREPGEPCPAGADHRHYVEELPFLLRVLWFLVLGWTLGFVAIVAGYLIALTIVGIPVGIYILNRVPLMTTLSRHYS